MEDDALNPRPRSENHVAEDHDDRLESPDLDVALARVRSRGSWRVRYWLAGVSLVALLAFVGIFAAQTFLATQTNAAPPVPPYTSYEIDLAVNLIGKGTFTINGKPYVDVNSATFTPRNGMNMVKFADPGLPTLTCQIQWLPRLPQPETNNPCSVWITGDRGTAHPPTFTRVFSILVAYNLTNLPPAMLATFASNLTQATPPPQTITVPAGDYYATGRRADGSISIKQASTPLTATYGPSYTLQSSTVMPDEYTQDLSAATPGLVFTINATYSWQFRQPDLGLVGGLALPNVTPDILVFDPTNGTVTFPGTIHSTFPSPYYPSPACIGGVQLIEPYLPQMAIVAQGGPDHQLAGCTFDVAFQTGRASGPNQTPAAPLIVHVIYRFGALLAADSTAQKIFPQFPLAPTDEIAATG